ncbi:MAG: RNA 2',3'-cyclic phosphodiesterase [Bacteroidota bacterium]|nr:RNA 2',3'-cyclic phosphodiesterase [Bacteroidota bacterium]
MRLFISIDSPASVKAQMAEIQAELKKSQADVKWETADKFHITLKFLGETKDELLPAINGILETVGTKFPPFQIEYDDIGCFPNWKQPRVIWLGANETSGTLLKLKRSLDIELEKLGFETEDRKFHPHITLGRVKSQHNIKNLTVIMESLKFKSEITTCREILLMRSILKPSGSEYSTLTTVDLQNT